MVLDALELIAAIRILSADLETMLGTLERVQDRCSSLLDVSRAAKRLVDGAGSLEELEGEVAKLRELEAKLGVT